MRSVLLRFYIYLFVALGVFLPGGFALATRRNIFFSETTFCGYIGAVINFAVGVVGILTVVMIVFGGVQYMTSSGNPERVKSSKETIVGSLIGMILVFTSYLFFQTLSPNILVCKEPNPTQNSPTTKSSGAGYSPYYGYTQGNGFAAKDYSKTDICSGTSYKTAEECKTKDSGAGTCLKGKKGYCKSTCGHPPSKVLQTYASKFEGACFINNHCAFTVTRALIDTGCTDFTYSSSTPAVARQLKSWGFKEHLVGTDYKAALAKMKPGAILIYRGHTAMYAGNGQIIHSQTGNYAKCGMTKDQRTYNQTKGKELACAKKNPYPDRSPTNNSLPSKIASTYLGKSQRNQCAGRQSYNGFTGYMNGRNTPLLSFYQVE